MWKRRLKDKEPARSIFQRPFWRFFGLLGDLFILSAFWILTSLPLVTMGASTAALFYVFFKTRAGEQGTLWKMYKKSFLENWKQGTFLQLLYLFIAVDLGIIGYMLCENGLCAPADFAWGGKYFAATLALILLYTSVTIYTAALLARFRQTTAQCALSALSLTCSRILSTLLFLLIIAALFFVTVFLFPMLLLIDVPLAVYLISLRMDGVFTSQIERVKRREEAARQEI